MRRTIEAPNWHEFEPIPSQGVAIVGFKEVTALGDEWETFQKLLNGVSGAQNMEDRLHPQQRVKIGAPLPPGHYNPVDQLHPEDKTLGLSTNSVSSILLTRGALKHAGLLSHNRRTIVEGIPVGRSACFVSSGIAATDTMIDIDHLITDRGPHRVTPNMALQIFPEEPNGDVAVALRMKRSKGLNLHQACATSLSNIVELSKLIRAGVVIAGVAGGFEDALDRRPDLTIAAFAALRALSTRNSEPEKASRPWDLQRDGFLAGSGGGVVVLEELDHAVRRGTRIYGIIRGEGNAMDGHKKTELDPEVVAHVMREALYDKRLREFHIPDAIFAHATSTPAGDGLEARALVEVFGQLISGIPVTAVKSMIGHLLGGAGAVNFITAVQCMKAKKMPRNVNLEEPGSRPNPEDPEGKDDKAIKQLNLVRDRTLEIPIESALVTGYGFGGYDAAAHIESYKS